MHLSSQFLRILTSLLAGLLLMGCGGEIEMSGGKDLQAQIDAETAVITLQDLPTGWQEEEPEGSDSEDPCKIKGMFRDMEIAWALSMHLTNRTKKEILDNYIVVFPDTGSADEAVSAMVDRWMGCDPEAIRRDMFGQAPAVYFIRSTVVSRLLLPRLADRAEGVRIAVIGEAGSFPPVPDQTLAVYDLVYVRMGPMVSIIYTGAVAAGSALLQQMAELSARKMQQVTESSAQQAAAAATEP